MNARPRVKFCGITCAEDALAAAHLGADAVGLVFYPQAAVALSPAEAAAVRAVLPPFVSAVALFVDAPAAAVQEVITTVRPHLLQFHGSEDAAFCTQFGLPYLKVCRLHDGSEAAATAAAHPHCSGLLLDAASRDAPGGTGKTFDWELIPAQCALPLIVAGGLHAGNVGALLQQVRPWGVDVSSGIAEDGTRRRKNWDKMASFMKVVRDAHR